MNLNALLYYKKELGYSFQTLAELSGVPQSTIQKIFNGITTAPRQKTVEALEKVLLPQEPSDIVLNEPPAPYIGGTAAKKLYTLEDYYALPDDVRVELIDGVFYDMSSPSAAHQLIAGEIFRQVKNQIKDKKGPCMVFTAPFDVQLDKDEYTMVEPDVLIVCDRSKINGRCVYGAPDFVCEILSKSTRRKDMSLKMFKYANAGVREYWIIDPEKETVDVYDFDNDDLERTLYSFDDTIGLRIYNEEISVDFQQVKEDLAGWAEASS